MELVAGCSGLTAELASQPDGTLAHRGAFHRVGPAAPPARTIQAAPVPGEGQPLSTGPLWRPRAGQTQAKQQKDTRVCWGSCPLSRLSVGKSAPL